MWRRWTIAGLAVLMVGAVVWLVAREEEPEPSPAVVVETSTPHHAEHPQVFQGSDGGTWKVEGVVTNTEGSPVPNAVVQARLPTATAMGACVCEELIVNCREPEPTRRVLALIAQGGLAPGATMAQTTADERGRFELVGLPPHELELVGLAGGAQGVTEISEVPTEPVELTIHAPQTITVQIVMEGEETPVTGAPVVVASLETGELQRLTSDGEGYVKVTTVDDAPWFGVDLPGYLPAGQRLSDGERLSVWRPRTLIVQTRVGSRPVDALVRLQGHDTREVQTVNGEVRLENLSMLRPMTVQAELAGLVSPVRDVSLYDSLSTVVTLDLRQTATLEVEVLGPTGEAVPEPWIELIGEDYDSLSSDSKLRFERVPEGQFTLSAGASGYDSVNRSVDLAPGHNTTRVVLRPTAEMKGKVVDRAGKPVGGATIELEGPFSVGTIGAASDDEGEFSMELSRARSWTLHAWQPHVGAGSARATTGQPVIIRLEPRSVLEISVVDADGQALDESVSFSHVATGEARSMLVTAPFARVAGLKAGTWKLGVITEGRLPLLETVELGTNEVRRVRLQLQRGATVSGHVVDGHDQPVQGATVISEAPSSPRTDEHGAFEIGGLKPGPVTLDVITDEGGLFSEHQVTAPARDVVLRLPSVLKVTGRVTDERGRPITDYALGPHEVMNEQGAFALALPQDDYEIGADGFVPGKLRVDRAGDLGTIQLTSWPHVEGEVFGDGRPLPGVTVVVEGDSAQALTDAEGHFSVVVADAEHPVSLLAVRGNLSCRQQVRVGERARLILSRGTPVGGRVTDGRGRPVQTELSFQLVSQSSLQAVGVPTGPDGRFETTLLPGPWRVQPRFGAARAVNVGTTRVELELVESDTCSVLASGNALTAFAMPQSAPASLTCDDTNAVPDGAFELAIGVGGIETEVPCGRYTVVGCFSEKASSPVVIQVDRPRVLVQLVPPS